MLNTFNISPAAAKSQYSHFRDSAFRPYQEEAIRFILESDKKLVVLCAPCGLGKSLAAMIAGQIIAQQANDRFLYLVSSRQLQQQLQHDFPEAEIMWGRGRFPCDIDRNRTAAECTHTKLTPCKQKHRCAYEVQKRKVLNHSRQILNYAYFLFESNYVGKFTHKPYPVIIVDEADLLEGLLMSFIQLQLSSRDLDALNLNPPQYRTAVARNGIASWQAWVQNEARVKLDAELDSMELIIQNFPRQLADNQVRLLRKYNHFKSIAGKLDIFSEHMSDTWLFDEKTHNDKVQSWTFQPTWLTPELANQYFFRYAEKFVLLSATFPPKAILAETLGLHVGDIDYLELPSSFPIVNRPIVLNPVANMTYKTIKTETPKLLAAIKEIVNRHPDEKGIIHCVNWRLENKIMELNGSCRGRLLSHHEQDKQQVLRRFTESPDPLVFVSPSSTRGLDLPDDLARWIIIAKAPFQSLNNKQVSARVYGSQLGRFWLRSICAQDVLQAAGRALRPKDDYAITYLLDSQIFKLVTDSPGLFPQYFKDAIEIAGM